VKVDRSISTLLQVFEAVAVPFDPAAPVPARAGRMMRIVDNARAFTVRHELAGDRDDVAGMERHGRREIDIIDDIDAKTVFGDDRERLMKRVCATTNEVARLVCDRPCDDDVFDSMLGSGASDGVVWVAVEKRPRVDRDHIAGAIARGTTDV